MHEQEMTSDEWPFADSTNTATITTRQVLHEGDTVLFVSHDSDGTWQILCGTTTDEADALVISLGEAPAERPLLCKPTAMPRGVVQRGDAHRKIIGPVNR